MESFDVIVIGADCEGHETMLSSSRTKTKNLRLMINIDHISCMSFNPVVGGLEDIH